MNNFISPYCINVLVGILFSFPVFSAEGSVSLYFAKKESNVSGNELSLNNIADSRNKVKENVPRKKYLNDRIALSQKMYLLKKNTDCSQNLSPPVYFFHLISDVSTSYIHNLHPYIVDITYLKQLRITKMLC